MHTHHRRHEIHTEVVNGSTFGEFANGDGRRGNVFLQQAETVRLATDADGGYRSVTDAKVGDPVLVRFSESGTHVGRAVAGSVEER